MASSTVTEPQTPYVKDLRKAMNAAEAIMGDTDTPIKVRVTALKRLTTFWGNLITELERTGNPADNDPL